ncbi:alpha/beta fold hydrolase [Chromatocurvus halotolerans]|uniref:Pimeloyl-ACP methyl ester carboxylesterase n=1 Tax=Chromatocurvus halotolerans TaxID=1132028 RepID=A0A4R2L090_9GAMM|nr:alpha/beta hydrolase [Chromatocurvus halotolerans]TCO77169.1 pimeloyl-ACP methyl ester carboxylesterase [Chromatocurvus halotolerans]
MSEPLPPAFDADTSDWTSQGCGRVSYYSDTSAPAGRPLLLLHSINAAPSAMEMKPLFEHYRGRRPVYAPDLPGFGQSERGDRDYSPALYADTIRGFLAEVIGEPADVVALSTSSEFAARAALASNHVRSLALISPTGFGARPRPSKKTRDRLFRFFSTPIVGSGLYKALTVKPSVRYFLNMGFEGRPPRELVNYAHRTTNVAGAQFAPFCFLSMRLFTDDAPGTLYHRIAAPVLVLYDRDPNISFERLPEVLDQHDNWRSVRISPTLGLPHWEQPEQTFNALDEFWNTPAGE